jgi:hypothetical protein
MSGQGAGPSTGGRRDDGGSVRQSMLPHIGGIGAVPGPVPGITAGVRPVRPRYAPVVATYGPAPSPAPETTPRSSTYGPHTASNRPHVRAIRVTNICNHIVDANRR